MTLGLNGDVNNSIFFGNAYPVGRTFGSVPRAATDFSVRNNMVGELGGLNQDFRGFVPTNASMADTMRTGGASKMIANGNGNGNGPKPAIWWLVFAVVFIIVAYVARKFAPDGEQFAIIKPNLINWVFVTLTVILTIVFLKQIALRTRKVPVFGTLSELVLSV